MINYEFPVAKLHKYEFTNRKSTLSTSNASMNKGEVRKASVGGKANTTRTAASFAPASTTRAAIHVTQPTVDPQVFIKLFLDREIRRISK